MGFLLLEGGAEFGGRMSEPDLQAIQMAGGLDISIAILPTAAAPDHNHERAGGNGLRWFQSLGASHVELVPVIDSASARQEALAARIRAAKFIYLLGGFPRHLEETLRDSLVWDSALAAFGDGAVLGGSSAGAMVLCEYYYDPDDRKLRPGLNLLHNCCVLPHHNNFGARWASQLAPKLPRSQLIGLDEQTGILSDDSGYWTVSGAGKVTLYAGGQVPEVYRRGDRFSLNQRPVQSTDLF